MSRSALWRTRGVAFAVAVLAIFFAPLTPVAAVSTFTISGHVYLGSVAHSAEASEVYVTAHRIDDYGSSGTTVATDGSGAYSIPGQVPGEYTIYFNYRGVDDFANQYWGNAAVSITSTHITISPTGIPATSGLNIVLPQRATLSGRVSLGETGTFASANAVVSWQRADGWGNWLSSPSDKVTVDASGNYSTTLDPGTYKITYQSSTYSYQGQRWDGPATVRYQLVFGTANLPNQDMTLPPFGSISGHVNLGTASVSAGAGEVEVKRYVPGLSGGEPTVLTDALGNFSFPKQGDGTYVLAFRHLGGLYQPLTLAPTILSAADRDPVLTVQLAMTNTVSGHVSLGSGATAAGGGDVLVTAYGAGSPKTAVTDAAGNYSISALNTGSYRIEFTYLGAGDYADAWWPGVAFQDQSTSVWVAAAGATADVVLPQSASMAGRVTLSSGAGAAGVTVILVHRDGQGFDAVTDGDGYYSFPRIFPGNYPVRYFRSGIGSSTFDEVEYSGVTLAAGQPIIGHDRVLYAYASVAGTAICDLCASSNFQWAHPSFGIQQWDPAIDEWRGVDTVCLQGPAATANYAFNCLRPGKYRLLGNYDAEVGPQWGYGFSPSFTLVEGQTLSGFNLVMSSHAGTNRIEGSDRFAVAAAISLRGFAGGADTVVIASGLNFPDALGAGPGAVAAGGPLLLVKPESIPASIRTELLRLRPKHIVIVGGPGAISAAVEAELRALPTLISEPNKPPVMRLGGANRYETSVNTADYFFPSTVPTVFIATGRNFPDALSAGPAAAQKNAPVVIVNGLSTTLDAATRSFLLGHGTTKVYIVGGAGAVSQALMNAIGALGISVERLAGADRYATSMAVSQSAFFGPTDLFMAVGTKYPDALAGGVLAGARGVPLVIVPPSCVGDNTIVGILNLMPETITLLGGRGALADPDILFRHC